GPACTVFYRLLAGNPIMMLRGRVSRDQTGGAAAGARRVLLVSAAYSRRDEASRAAGWLHRPGVLRGGRASARLRDRHYDSRGDHLRGTPRAVLRCSIPPRHVAWSAAGPGRDVDRYGDRSRIAVGQGWAGARPAPGGRRF